MSPLSFTRSTRFNERHGWTGIPGPTLARATPGGCEAVVPTGSGRSNDLFWGDITHLIQISLFFQWQPICFWWFASSSAARPISRLRLDCRMLDDRVPRRLIIQTETALSIHDLETANGRRSHLEDGGWACRIFGICSVAAETRMRGPFCRRRFHRGCHKSAAR